MQMLNGDVNDASPSTVVSVTLPQHTKPKLHVNCVLKFFITNALESKIQIINHKTIGLVETVTHQFFPSLL